VRLLFGEQLAEELCDLVRDAFPDSLHVRRLGRGGASDDGIWQLARGHGCVLVTKDEVATLLLALRSDIGRFVDQDEATFLELGRRP
jgi:predicted nuclease of predicted toxin-antitoxin system